MRMMIGWIGMGGALLACASCGFKGPLYLPERTTTVITHPAPAAPGAQGTMSGQPRAPAANRKQTSPPASPPSPPPSYP